MDITDILSTLCEAADREVESLADLVDSTAPEETEARAQYQQQADEIETALKAVRAITGQVILIDRDLLSAVIGCPQAAVWLARLPFGNTNTYAALCAAVAPANTIAPAKPLGPCVTGSAA